MVLEFFTGLDRVVVLTVTAVDDDPLELAYAFEYLDGCSVMEFFRDWNYE